jgi:hypothetical protein
MRQARPVQALTVTAVGAITAARFVGTDGDQAAAAANAFGVAETDAAAGDALAVTSLGTAIVETGAAIAAGALVEADASGRAVTRSAGAILGRLAPDESASAAGQFVEVILIPN